MSAHELDDGKCPLRDRTTISKHSRRSQAAFSVNDAMSTSTHLASLTDPHANTCNGKGLRGHRKV